MHDVFDARAMIQLGAVESINDTGQAQTVTVVTGSGARYSDIEVVQTYGAASNTPVDGAVAMLFCIGGDPANMRAFVYNPSKRYGKQAAGKSTVFAPDGTRVSVRAGGVIDIKGGNQINIVAPNAVITATTAVSVTSPRVTVEASSGMAITSPDVTIFASSSVTVTSPDVTIEGSLHITGGGTIDVAGVKVIVP